MSIEFPLEQAPLNQLAQTPIDNVLNIIDQNLVHLPSYRDLYYRWERQQWQAQDLDFTVDRQQWESMSREEQMQRTGGLATFFKGEACVTDTLPPYITAMPDEEMRIFITTQIVDEARHTVFFSRFFNEVCGFKQGSLEADLGLATQTMSDEMRFILMDSLTEVSERIRQNPGQLEHLVDGVTLYHVVIEGTMALAGQRSILEFYRLNNLFPAFRAGFTAVARDESRHVVFGVKFLREMIQRNKKYAQVVQKSVNKFGALALEALAPLPEEIDFQLAAQQDPWGTMRFAQDSLRKKLKVVGLEMMLPQVQIPASPF